MKISRWTLGIGLAAVVSLLGLVQAGASPFAMYFLANDLGDTVNGTAPEQSQWADGGDDSAGGDDADDSGNGNGNGNGNNGHGNNEDGVDSSNPSQGHGGPNGEEDASCPADGECVDDEIGGGSSTDTDTDTDSDSNGNSNKDKNKNK